MFVGVCDCGWFDCECVVFESLIGFKWVGCDGILFYFVLEVVELFKLN